MLQFAEFSVSANDPNSEDPRATLRYDGGSDAYVVSITDEDGDDVVLTVRQLTDLAVNVDAAHRLVLNLLEEL